MGSPELPLTATIHKNHDLFKQPSVQKRNSSSCNAKIKKGDRAAVIPGSDDL
jgi:hypothetical protein